MNGMNGLNDHSALPGLWQEARNSDGRVYYYNTITKATQWTKPEELMTPAEVRIYACCLIVPVD
jgi:pre-mRNA-processing factor 40